MSLVEVLAEYEEMLRERYSQYVGLKAEGDLVKAGETLWSMIMVLLSMIGLLLGSGPLARHREAKVFVKTELAALYGSLYGGDPGRLVALFEAAERLHANFYHEFLDTEQLLWHLGAGEELATLLRGILDSLAENPAREDRHPRESGGAA